MPSDSYTLTISDVGISTPATDSVTNASVAAGAAIAFSKLATLTSGNILVGNSSNVPTSVTVTGDVTVSNTGVAAIASGAIVNADVNASAAIAYSKLASLTSGNIIVGNSSNVPTAVTVTGDVTISNTGVTSIGSEVIVNADISSSAQIAHSKLATMASGNIIVGNSGGGPTSVAVTGNVTISDTGVTTIANDAVTFAKIQNVSGYSILAKPTAGSGDVAEVVSTDYMLAASTGFLRQGSASEARGALGIADANSGNVLLSNGVDNDPGYGKVNLTTHVSGALPVAYGGTGQTSYAIGDIIYASSATTLAKLADVYTGSVLISGGVGVAPAYGKVGLTTHVDGTLPVANGGTGAATLTGYVKGSGTTAMTANATVPVADVSGLGTGVATFLATPSSANLATAVTGETGSGALVFASNPSLIAPVLGVATGTSLAATGAITSSGTAGIGYAGAGVGGTVTQITNKSTLVTLNKTCGQITMSAASLAQDTTATFTLVNTTIAASDVLILNHISGGTIGKYLLNAQCAAGSASINVTNVTTGSASEAIVIAFVVIKAATA